LSSFLRENLLCFQSWSLISSCTFFHHFYYINVYILTSLSWRIVVIYTNTWKKLKWKVSILCTNYLCPAKRFSKLYLTKWKEIVVDHWVQLVVWSDCINMNDSRKMVSLYCCSIRSTIDRYKKACSDHSSTTTTTEINAQVINLN
jgi:hypothetical protein